MKNKHLIPLIAMFASALLFGTTYSAWVYDSSVNVDNTAQIEVPDWEFDDSDFARFDNVNTCNYLTASKETTIVNGSNEAIKLTNTAGTQSKAHSFNVSLDRDYTVGEIKTMKVEFDYYHAHKREQNTKGLPKVQLLYDNANKGNQQGGGDTVNSKSVFTVSDIDSDWWHLEYFITALCPTMSDHGDSVPKESTKINGIKITDDNIYDYNSTTAYVVIDNLQFSSELSDRLGLFNRTSTMTVGGYFWFKVAWVGELHSVNFTFSNNCIEHDDASTKSPFYIHGLSAGSCVVTATLEVGDTHQILSISNTITVS